MRYISAQCQTAPMLLTTMRMKNPNPNINIYGGNIVEILSQPCLSCCPHHPKQTNNKQTTHFIRQTCSAILFNPRTTEECSFFQKRVQSKPREKRSSLSCRGLSCLRRISPMSTDSICNFLPVTEPNAKQGYNEDDCQYHCPSSLVDFKQNISRISEYSSERVVCTGDPPHGPTETE